LVLLIEWKPSSILFVAEMAERRKVGLNSTINLVWRFDPHPSQLPCAFILLLGMALMHLAEILDLSKPQVH